ncbi:hypothetical protein D3C81_1949440 [compost metagenome]
MIGVGRYQHVAGQEVVLIGVRRIAQPQVDHGFLIQVAVLVLRHAITHLILIDPEQM